MIMRSANVPESPSSALQTTYFWSAGAPSTVFHLMPVGNAAPPRPRRPESVTARDDLLAGHLQRVRETAVAAVRAIVVERQRDRSMPTRANVRRVCFARYSIFSVGPSASAVPRGLEKLRGEQTRHVGRGDGAVRVPDAVDLDLDERLEPVEAARAVADDVDRDAALARPRPRWPRRLRRRRASARWCRTGRRLSLRWCSWDQPTISSMRSGVTRP